MTRRDASLDMADFWNGIDTVLREKGMLK